MRLTAYPESDNHAHSVAVYLSANLGTLTVSTGAGREYFAECGLRNAESCQGVICGKFDADFFLRNEG